MRRCIYIGLILLTSTTWGQQRPISNFSEYMHISYNPSLVGQMLKTNIGMVHRSWWSGFDNSPNNQWLFGELNLDGHHGVGLAVNRDVRGLTGRIGVNGSYSYAVRLNRDSRLLFGITGKWEQYSMAMNNAVLIDSGDPMVNGGTTRENIFDANFGITYARDELIIGVSSTELLEQDAQSAFTNLKRNLFFHGSYTIKASEEVDLLPHVFVRYAQETPVSVMVDLNARYKEFAEFGVGYNHGYAVNLNLGVYHKSLYLGYSYDVGLNGISNMGLGHEVMIGFRQTLGNTNNNFREYYITEEEALVKIYKLIDQYFSIAESDHSANHKQVAMDKIRKEIHEYLAYIYSEEQQDQIKRNIGNKE